MRSVLLGTKSLLPIKQEIVILAVSAVTLYVVGCLVFYAFDARCRRLGTIGGIDEYDIIS